VHFWGTSKVHDAGTSIVDRLDSDVASPLPTPKVLMRSVSFVLLAVIASVASAQQPPYDTAPSAQPPYYRVRYEASPEPGELVYPVSYTVWIPPAAKVLRGLIIHQHGCGEGSCKSGLTGAFDLHWQALAKKHDCALMSPVYEQPDKADCQMWCDPRNGSDATFQKSLLDLGRLSEHTELSTVPWAIWGHSGGGHWAGGMFLLHPQRVAAAWLRSGVPALKTVEGKPNPYVIPEAAAKVPVMCNLGTKEGVTVRAGRFAGVWPQVELFFRELRSRGGLVGVAIDPLSSHECGNQRYLAVPWFDACLSARLPARQDDPLAPMSGDQAWVTTLDIDDLKNVTPIPRAKFDGEIESSIWLPNQIIAKAWAQYVDDTAVTDNTPPPAPTNLKASGNVLNWEAEADLESGLAGFIIERDGQFLARVPAQEKNPFGRPIFQNLQYSDTPSLPLVETRFTDVTAEAGESHQYRVIAVNTVGLQSP
jgi:pimeloyl-ACP methyl ester carboxylesterase